MRATIPAARSPECRSSKSITPSRAFYHLENGSRGDHTKPRAKGTEEIYSRDRSSTWFRRQSLQFHEGLFFAPSTFSRSTRGLIRAHNAATTCFTQDTYTGITRSETSQNQGFKRCKVEASLYTDFTPRVRTNPMMRSIIGAVI